MDIFFINLLFQIIVPFDPAFTLKKISENIYSLIKFIVPTGFSINRPKIYPEIYY